MEKHRYVLREFLSLKKKDNYLNDGKTTLMCMC